MKIYFTAFRGKKVLKRSVYIFGIYFAALSIIAYIGYEPNVYSVREYNGFDSSHQEIISAAETFDYKENLHINNEYSRLDDIEYIDSPTLSELDFEISETPLKPWITYLFFVNPTYSKGYTYNLNILEPTSIILDYDTSGIRQVIQSNGENKTIVNTFSGRYSNWYVNSSYYPAPSESNINISYDDVILLQIDFKVEKRLTINSFTQCVGLNDDFQVMFVVVWHIKGPIAQIIQPFIIHLFMFTAIMCVNSIIEFARIEREET